MRKVLLWMMLLILLMMIAACGQNNDADEEETAVTSVEVEQIKKDNLQVTKSFYGMIMPQSQMPVTIEQPGEVSELYVQNGEFVSKDDTVAKVKTPVGEMTVTAPRTGKVAKLSVKEGDFQTNEEPLMMVADVDKVIMNVAVSKSDRSLFKGDKEVTVHIDDDTYKGNVLPVDPLPNEGGQFTIEIEIDNKDEKISPGTTGKITMKETKVKKGLLVPTEAVLQEADENFVYIVQDGKAKKVLVEVIETQTEYTAIKGDVNTKDEVIVNGHFTLTDGSEVEVIKDGNNK
ncbi:efflux RND transporter periplasmic adaptor subunit [Pseudogracilibacillus sp. ICA-222130]|uniref:efflux RND transporter periplasmic adaptor subunit n=1 Tax=Pseudogracilibacillus sp. ICA-222130 TaxID=3134655 RepID=UPI0030BDF887